MNTRNRSKILSAFLLSLILLQSACAAPQRPPTATAIENTSTPVATSTPSDTPTPEPTATFTQTPEPTATSTPNVTATLLPEIPVAVDGKGNVAGLVLWNNQPVAKAAVWLCEDFAGACLGTYQYRANTDAHGYYVFKNVTPGDYIVAINSFSTGWFIFYFDSNGKREQTVLAGENLILNPLNIWKFDLRATSPKVDKVLGEATPAFTWEAYPDAAYYEISIYDINFKDVVTAERVDGLEYQPSQPLVTCRFYWDVDAFNADGVKISSTSPGAMYFYVIDVPGKC